MGKKLQIGINDLHSQKPELALEWHPTQNGSLTPQMVSVFSSKRVWWQRKEYRFGKEFVLEWDALVSNRSNGSDCPYTSVSPRKLLVGFNDLQSTNPELAEKWHPDKNGDLKPDMVFENTDRHVWWQHKTFRWGKEFIHEWQASPKDVKRGGDNCGCPICHGTKVLTGYNDLLTFFPELCEEWDYDQNAALGLTPETVTPGSNKKVHWICKWCGHSWKAMILNRTSKQSSCPKCSQRTQTSFPEQAIYYYFRQAFAHCTNRDKTVIEKGELDIYLPDYHFAVEYCGLFSHASEEKRTADAKKKEECTQKGIHLILVYEDDHMDEFRIDEQIIYCVPKNDYSHLHYVMSCLNEELSRLGISNTPITINLKADEKTIREQYQQSQIDNSIAITHPHLLEEWDYELNGLLKPQGFTAGCGVSIHWKHTAADRSGEVCLHRWEASISKRAQGQCCPICAGKIVQPGFNDLKSLNPFFLSEWDSDQNEILPEQITAYSHKKVWWKHKTVANRRTKSHRWKASPNERMHGNGCAICAGKIIEPGTNDLATTHPELLTEWDFGKNHISPDTISYGYDKKVWWTHTITQNNVPSVHSWEASPNSRTNMESGCPFCSNKKVLPGFNDLETRIPEIAALWDYDKNHPMKPCEFTAASGKKVYWTDRERTIKICDRTKYLRNKKQ